MRRFLAAALVLASAISTSQTVFAQGQLPKLIEALESEKKAVRLQAVTAIGNHGTGARSAAPALMALLVRERESQNVLQAVQALAQIGAHAQLRELLGHPQQPIRWQAVAGLAVIGPPAKKAVPDLLALLTDEQPIMRCLAANALGEIGLEKQADMRRLLKLLADVDPEVRPHALYAVMNLGPNSVPALETMLSEKESEWVRTASLQALANQGPAGKSVVPKLIEMLKDPSSTIRAQTASTLAAIGSDAKDALPTLLENLLDKDVQVQMCSFQATLAVGQGNRGALSDGLKVANARGRWAATVPIDKNTVPNLIKKLAEKDTNTRVAAALALGRIGLDAEPAIGPLTRLLKDKDENKQVQSAARQALAQLDQKNAEVYLKKLRSEREQWLREAKEQQSKFAVGKAKIFKDILKDIQGAQEGQADQARQLLQLAIIGKQKLSVAVRNPPQQAYLRQLVAAHIGYSIMPDQSPEPDWVRDQINDTGIEAVPALVEGINVCLLSGTGFV